MPSRFPISAVPVVDDPFCSEGFCLGDPCIVALNPGGDYVGQTYQVVGATSVQWMTDGTDVPGATGQFYTTTTADIGKYLTARAIKDEDTYEYTSSNPINVEFYYERTVNQPAFFDCTFNEQFSAASITTTLFLHQIGEGEFEPAVYGYRYTFTTRAFNFNCGPSTSNLLPWARIQVQYTPNGPWVDSSVETANSGTQGGGGFLYSEVGKDIVTSGRPVSLKINGSTITIPIQEYSYCAVAGYIGQDAEEAEQYEVYLRVGGFYCKDPGGIPPGVFCGGAATFQRTGTCTQSSVIYYVGTVDRFWPVNAVTNGEEIQLRLSTVMFDPVGCLEACGCNANPASICGPYDGIGGYYPYGLADVCDATRYFTEVQYLDIRDTPAVWKRLGFINPISIYLGTATAPYLDATILNKQF